MLNSVSVNLMVTDMVASLGFYHEVLCAPLAFTADGEQNTEMPGEINDKVVFASVKVGESEIMLQERQNLLQDSPAFDASTTPGASITLYFRVEDVDEIAGRLPEGTVILKPLETTWYGMREIWVRDPDGYVLTIGTPDGAPPEVNNDVTFLGAASELRGVELLIEPVEFEQLIMTARFGDPAVLQHQDLVGVTHG